MFNDFSEFPNEFFVEQFISSMLISFHFIKIICISCLFFSIISITKNNYIKHTHTRTRSRNSQWNPNFAYAGLLSGKVSLSKSRKLPQIRIIVFLFIWFGFIDSHQMPNIHPFAPSYVSICLKLKVMKVDDRQTIKRKTKPFWHLIASRCSFLFASFSSHVEFLVFFFFFFYFAIAVWSLIQFKWAKECNLWISYGRALFRFSATYLVTKIRSHAIGWIYATKRTRSAKLEIPKMYFFVSSTNRIFSIETLWHGQT